MTGHKSSDYQYLEKLEFNPELRKSWLNFFVVNFRVVILLIILLTALGLFSYSRLPVESDPEVKIPIAVVTVAFPGASPADIEELVTKKLETEIAGLKDIEKITSNSRNSLASVTVEFSASADLDDSIRKLRDAAQNVKDDLPEDANDPIVSEISVDDTPIFSASLAGPYDGFTLRALAEDMQEELEKIPGVREVRVSGGDEKEFEIAYDPEKLAFYNLAPAQINQVVAAANTAVPGGNFEGERFNYSVRTDARFFDAATLANIPVFHGGNNSIVYLRDVAEVRERAIKRTVYSRFSQDGKISQESISIEVIKKTGGSIIETADAAKVKLDEMITAAPEGVHYDITIDTAKEIRKNFDQLSHDFILTVILVFTILLLVVGLKEALVASLAIPLVFFATFGVMNWAGTSLNFLSMISLILALGLLVDDAIVVVSATKQYLKTGKFTPEEAVLLVLNDFKIVLLTTTLTTVWAFLPILFATGIIGEFIRSIPITVSVTLLASLIIALVINHPLAAVLERVRLGRRSFFLYIFLLVALGAASLIFFVSPFLKGIFLSVLLLAIFWMLDWYRKGGKEKLHANEELAQKEWSDDEAIKAKLLRQGSHIDASFSEKFMHGIVRFDKIIPVYERYLCRVLATKKSRVASLVLVAALLAAAIALPVTGIVKSEFFPVTDQELIFINLEAPTGLRLEENDKIVRQVEEKLLVYPEIVNFSTIVGGSSSANQLGGGSSSSNLASITVKLKEKEDRDILSYDLAEVIRHDLEEIEGATISVESLGGGPPAGSAFEARIMGANLETLERIAGDLKPVLASIPGVVNADMSLKSSPADYTFALDHARMELLGVNAAAVGATIRTAISGTEVTEILQEGDETKVMARFSENKIPDLTTLTNLQINNAQGDSVFLKDVASVRLEPSVEKITRIDQTRTVLLSAGVSGKTIPARVVAEFQNKVKDNYALPAGYEIVYGGENEQNAESVQSIIRAMAIALVLIVSTLVVQFNSFRKSFIVLVTIPLALIGVFVGLAVFRINLTFPGLIGIVALFGIVVKNAIILVDKINLNIRTGIPFKESIVDAGKSRIEAIFITSICTIVGITPVTISNETWLALGSAIIFGLALSSFFTLFVIPTLFYMLVKPVEEKI